MSSQSPPQNVLFLALSGIGNVLMQLPTIEAIRKAWPDARVIVWVAPRGTKALVAAVKAIDVIIEGKIQRSVLGHTRFAAQLAQHKPDVAIMLSPGQLIKGALYMYFSGAHRRLAHTYPHLGNPQSRFLLTDSIIEEAGLHDIEQNLKLLEPLRIPTDHLMGQPYHFLPPQDNREQAEKLIQSYHIPDQRMIIGLHAGSAPAFLWKRWPLEHFATVARQLIAQHQAHILLFGGPDEKNQNKYLQKMIGASDSTTVATDLITTAAVMQHCRFVLANDSGLMHLAAAVGVPTFGLFGPTDERSTGPRGTHSEIIRAEGTKPVYTTELGHGLGQKPHATLLKITPAAVVAAIAKAL